MFHSSYGRKACLNKWSLGNTKRSTAAAAPIQSSNILITKMVILFVHKRALQETKDGQRNGGKQSSLDHVCSSERQNFLFFHSSKVELQKVAPSVDRHKTIKRIPGIIRIQKPQNSIRKIKISGRRRRRRRTANEAFQYLAESREQSRAKQEVLLEARRWSGRGR